MASESKKYQIEVSNETFEKLLMYKKKGMTMDRLINYIIDNLPDDIFYEPIIREHEIRLRRMKKGEYLTREQLDEELKEL